MKLSSKTIHSFLVSHSLAWLALIGVLLIDQLTKRIISTMQPQESIPLIPNVFHLTFVQNTGIAFGFFQGGNTAFAILSVVVIMLVIGFLLGVKKEEKWLHISLGMLIGGALGNLIDRVLYGSVIDFLDFRVWPVFNAADSAITLSVICLVILLWKK